MNILMISGFLGAGKTTFIKELVRRTGRNFVVLENEMGEVDVDGAELDAFAQSLIEQHEILRKYRERISGQDPADAEVGKGAGVDAGTQDEQVEELKRQPNMLKVVELTEGCICCSMRGDLGLSVLTIANTVDPDFLIIEPTGVGLLSNILKSLSSVMYERIGLLVPVTVVDIHSFDRYEKKYGEYYSDQIANAGRIVISKMEQSDQEEVERLRAKLREMNPSAEIAERHYSRLPDEWWIRLLTDRLDKEGERILEKESPQEVVQLESLSFRDVTFTDLVGLITLLNRFINGEFGSVFRSKGIVRVGSELLLFELVDQRYSITGFMDEVETRMVVIGDHLDHHRLDEVIGRREKTGTWKQTAVHPEGVVEWDEESGREDDHKAETHEGCSCGDPNCHHEHAHGERHHNGNEA